MKMPIKMRIDLSAIKTSKENTRAFKAFQFGFNVLFFASCVAYPFFYTHLQMLVLMAILWTIKALLEHQILALFIALFFALLCFINSVYLRLLYPSLMSFIFGSLFLFSLKNEPFITRLARLKNPNLNEKALKYTRNLSGFWAIFLLANGVFALFLTQIDERIWQLWCGVGFYVAFGAIFAFEFALRQMLIKRASDE